MRVDTIVAYAYRAAIYCPTCIIEVMLNKREASPAARDMPVEEALDQIAEANAIDRYDEHTFDSSEFPKVCFPHMITLEDDFCLHCDEPIIED